MLFQTLSVAFPNKFHQLTDAIDVYNEIRCSCRKPDKPSRIFNTDFLKLYNNLAWGHEYNPRFSPMLRRVDLTFYIFQIVTKIMTTVTVPCCLPSDVVL